MENNYESVEYVEYVKKQPVWAFCLLSFFTFGLYNLYWFYKNWRFFKDLYGWDIYPFWRSVFAVFFAHALLERINDLAVEKGHPGIRSDAYATGYVALAIVQRVLDRMLPAEVVMLSLLLMPYLFLIPSVKQLNFIYEQANPGVYRPVFSAGELVALLLGGLAVGLVIIGTVVG